jgi:DNA-binding response OmpR family regulator
MMGNPAAPPCILIIDDDPNLVETLADTLELAGGYRIRSAVDGAQGLEAVAESPPDCVVVDVRMPHLNGLQFVRALRGDPATTHVPIVMLSALVQDHDQLNGLMSGADAYLRKPVRVQELLKAIHTALQISQEQRLAALFHIIEEDEHDGKGH